MEAPLAAHDGLTPQERYLVHQIHPAKLATDIAVSAISTTLFWRRRRRLGLLVLIVPSPVASALVMRLDLSAWRDAAAGRYVLAHMPPVMQVIRSISAI